MAAQHSIDDMLHQARNGVFKLVYVLVGPERFRLDRTVKALRQAVAGDGVAGFNEDILQGNASFSAAAAMATARTLPMMANTRFVLIRNAHQIAAREHAALVAYIEDPSPTTCLVITAEKLDGRSKLMRAAKKHKVLAEALPLKGGAIRKFAITEAKARGHVLGHDAADALIDALGDDLSAIDDALERLSLYVGAGQRVDLHHVEACVTRIRTESVWMLVDAVSMKDSARALLAASSLLADREPPLRILALLARQLRILAKMRQALASGYSGAEAVKIAGAPPFKANELTQAAKRFTLRSLNHAFKTIAATDRALKGSKCPPDALLQEAIVQLCAA